MHYLNRCFVIFTVVITCLICCTKRSDSNFDFLKNKIDSANAAFLTLYDSNGVMAENSARRMVVLSDSLNYPEGFSKALSNLSFIYEQNGAYDSALFYNIKSLEQRQKIKDTLSMALSYLNIARNYSKLKIQGRQRQCLQLALRYLKKRPDPVAQIEAISQVAILHASNEHYDSAKIYFNYALKLANAFTDSSLKAKTLVNYANILNQINAIDSALFYYQKGLAIYKKLNAYVTVSGTYNNIALVYWDLGNRDSTLYYLEKGYEQTKHIGNKRDHENNLLNLIDFWEEQKDLKKGNLYLNELLVLKDSVYKENLQKSISDIELNYAVKLKQEENEKLKLKLQQKNTVRNAAIVLSVLISLLAIYLLRFYRQKRQLALQEKKLAESEIDRLLNQRELQNLDALIEGRETERKRIGRDLHDRLGSILSTVKLYFSAIDSKLDSLKTENLNQYQKASDLLDEAVIEVRRISQDLVSGVLIKNGLVAALHDLKNSIELAGKIKINIFETGINIRLNPEIEIELYRILQELISNILKHAAANKADIHLSLDAQQFTIIVEDNGKGFDAQHAISEGLGIANIKQRVANLGGVVSFDSKLEYGTTVIIELNIDSKPLTGTIL